LHLCHFMIGLSFFYTLIIFCAGNALVVLKGRPS
jgi:hypothetical protein